MINPNDFIISRKRKKYRFAKFTNSPLCFEYEEWKKQAIDVVEVGAGNGLFSVELAARHPDQTFAAVDIKGDRLQRGAYIASERNIRNVSFIRARADQLRDLFPRSSASDIWLTFPDPFPKKRSAGRRLTHPTYLAIYHEQLKKDGNLNIKHDDHNFFQWSLEQLVEKKWYLVQLSFDLHNSNLSDDYCITTTYERKWLDQGKKTYFVRATI